MKYRQLFIILMSVMAWTAMSFPTALFGQSVGDRVRVVVEGDKMLGTVESMSQSSFDLKLAGDGSLRSVMYRDVERLERSAGTLTYKKRGFLIGAIPGGVLGGLVGWGASSFCPGLCETPSVGEQLTGMAVGSILFGVPTGLAGLVIGALVKGEKWDTIPTPSMSERLRISPVIKVASIGADRRVGLSTRIRF